MSCGRRSGSLGAGGEHLLDPLGQRDHDHAAIAKPLERAQPGRQLALAAVDHDHVRERGEARVVVLVVRGQVVLVLPARQPARQDLLHRREVVRLPDRRSSVLREVAADLEPAVVGLLRRPALEHDHRRHRVRAHQRRDVEALDPQRQRVQTERLLEPVERLDALLSPALGAQPLLVEREPGVALGELEDPSLVPALGGTDLDGAIAARA